MEFYLGFQTQTNAYNGNYLGITILNKGQQIKIQVDNQLSETTRPIGIRIAIFAPKMTVVPHNPIFPNTKWSPEFTVMDQTGTYWYHLHLHGKTFEQVIKSSRLIIIHDRKKLI